MPVIKNHLSAVSWRHGSNCDYLNPFRIFIELFVEEVVEGEELFFEVVAHLFGVGVEG